MKVGLQLYSIRNRFAKDPYTTLEDIKNAGYNYIEMANHNASHDIGTGIGLPLKDFKAKVDELGLTVVGAHILPTDPKNTLDPFFKDTEYFKRIIDFYAQLGSKHLSIPIDFFPTRDYLLGRCDVYNKLGALCRESDIRLLYHNHWNEFQRFDGVAMFDLIMQNTDPDYLGIEMDAYWMIRGAFDPVSKIHDYGKRIAIIHEKDFPFSRVNYMNCWNFIDQDVPCNWDSFHATVKPEDFIEVGDGMIKIQDVIDAGNKYNVPYILVEQDFTALDELDSIKRSMHNFRRMRDLEWDA